MSDPPIPHDLPEYDPFDPPQITWRRVRVFKEGDYWTWKHECRWRSASSNGLPYMSQKAAMRIALAHAGRCL